MAKRKSSPSPQPPPEAAQAATGGAHPGAQVVPPRVLTGPSPSRHKRRPPRTAEPTPGRRWSRPES